MQKFVLHSHSPEQTAAIAERISPHLTTGDTLLLSGPIGAGKSHFARALIATLLPYPEEIPSPSFTLVQVYDTDTAELWHVDLYRLSVPDQIVELGLAEAFDEAICIVEWPDRLGDMAPQDALSIDISVQQEPDFRNLTLRWTNPRWTGLLS